jgi:hypothetical protein
MFKREPYLKSSSPTTPLLPDVKKDGEKSWLEFVFDRVLCSRKTGKRIIMSLAIFQFLMFGRIALRCYSWHLSRMESLSASTFGFFLIQCLPSLLALPIAIGFMIWPFYIIFGMFVSRTFHDLHTVAPHLVSLRNLQQHIYTAVRDREFNSKMDAFHQSIGGRLPLELRMMVEEECARTHRNAIALKTAALRWKSKIQGQFQPSWNRVTLLWSMYTGINQRFNVPAYWSISIRHYWILVFSRDAFLVSLSCLFRFTMITWMLLAVNNKESQM